MELLTKIIDLNRSGITLEDEYSKEYKVPNEKKFYIYNVLAREYFNLPESDESFFVKCKIINYCIEGIKRKIIDPDSLLCGAIDECKDKKGLPLIAIALRNGANPNGYITTYREGTFHIMIYTVSTLRRNAVDDDLTSIILTMLAIRGGSSKMKTQKKMKSITFDEQDDTVANFLYENGFPDFIDLNILLDSELFSSDVKLFIKVLMDNPFIKTEEPIDENTFILRCIVYHSYELLRGMNIKPQKLIETENQIITYCIYGGSFDVFRIFFDKGFKFTYFTLNRLLTLIVTQKGLYQQIYKEFLRYVINKGVALDNYQFNMLERFSGDFAREIKEQYEKPLFTKSCSASSNIPLPKEVSELAFSLNLISSDTSLGKGMTEISGEMKGEVCKELYKYADDNNTDVYIENMRKRQKQLIQATTHKNTYSYGVGDSDIRCVNFGGDPLDYNPDTLIYHKDKDNMYCFTPSSFGDVMANKGKIPGSQKDLPVSVLQKMNNIMIFMKQMGIDPDKVKSFKESINSLNEVDKISNKHTQQAISFVEQTAKLYGIPKEQFQSITQNFPQIYTEILISLGFTPDYFNILSPEHRYASFCKYIHFYHKNFLYEGENVDVDVKTLESIYGDIKAYFKN